MKKGYALIALILTIFFPVKVFALTATVNMTCDDHGLPDVGTVSCTIAASTDDVVTGFHGVLSFSDDVSITNFALNSNFITFDGNITTNTSPVDIDIVTVAGEGIDDLEGDFTIATFDVSIKEESISSTQQVSLSSMKFYDVDVNTVNITDPVMVTFSDYLTINNYLYNDEILLIYGLSCPITANVFLANIASNAVWNIFNGDAIIAATDPLATGYKLGTTYRDGTAVEYTVSMLGDVLGEGNISVNGAKKISRHIIEHNVITGEAYLKAADYDQNNTIKMNDVVKMLKDIQE